MASDSPRDFKTDDLTGDLLFEAGDMVLDAGEHAFKDELKTRCRFRLGEWFLAEDEGLPYDDLILVKNPNLEAIRAAYRKMLIETPRVVEVVELELKETPGVRKLDVNWNVVGDLDGVITVTDSLEV